MQNIIARLVEGIDLTGDLPARVRTFLVHQGFPKTVIHSQQVAGLASELAQRFGADPARAETAGWLHDVSVVFLNIQPADMARQLGVHLIPEEEGNPVVAHQKLSVALANQVFGIADPEVLNAIGCHTTLRPGASPLDKVLFVADKIAWDQAGNPPYLQDMLIELQDSLDGACLVYLRSLSERLKGLPGQLHPLAQAALDELEQNNK